MLTAWVLCDTPGCDHCITMQPRDMLLGYFRPGWLRERGWAEVPRREHDEDDKRRHYHYCPTCVAWRKRKGKVKEISMKKFWIVVRAPSNTDTAVHKNASKMYERRKEANDRAKELAKGEKIGFLVLEVVGGYEPASPPIKPIKLEK